MISDADRMKMREDRRRVQIPYVKSTPALLTLNFTGSSCLQSLPSGTIKKILVYAETVDGLDEKAAKGSYPLEITVRVRDNISAQIVYIRRGTAEITPTLPFLDTPVISFSADPLVFKYITVTIVYELSNLELSVQELANA